MARFLRCEACEAEFAVMSEDDERHFRLMNGCPSCRVAQPRFRSLEKSFVPAASWLKPWTWLSAGHYLAAP